MSNLLQIVIFQDWNRYEHWLTHVDSLTHLLDSRGPDQFRRERGGQLFVQMRSQIVSLAPSSFMTFETDSHLSAAGLYTT